MPALRRGVSFRDLTTFGAGGKAAYVLRVKAPEELVTAVRLARALRIRHFLLAGGSNVVGADGLWPGLIIQYFNPGSVPAVRGRKVIVEAGVPLGSLIKAAIRHGLAGLENLSGIPGTVGGAIVGNAGAYGRCISDYLASVEIFDGRKNRTLAKSKCRFSYRDSIFKRKSWLALRAHFLLQPGNKRLLGKKSREIIEMREKKYRPSLRCPGSFFKNVLIGQAPERIRRTLPADKIVAGKIPAGFLLQAVGACGLKTAHLEVASYHGNLLINRGGATGAEVKRLALRLKRLVKREFGVSLEEEVRYVV